MLLGDDNLTMFFYGAQLWNAYIEQILSCSLFSCRSGSCILVAQQRVHHVSAWLSIIHIKAENQLGTLLFAIREAIIVHAGKISMEHSGTNHVTL